jgi:hypothetical protein
MPSRPLLFALVLSLPALAACGGGSTGGGGTTKGDPTPHVSYTSNGVTETMAQGLAEAGGVPHVEVHSGTLAVFAAPTACSRTGQAPQLDLMLVVEGAATGTYPGHLFRLEAGSGPTGGEEVNVTVTRLDADGGLVEATFRGASASGELVARRGDAVAFFNR